LNFMLSSLGILHRLTRTTVTPMLIPREHLGRANGFLQALDAGSQLVSPILAAALMNAIKIQGVILVDFSTYLFAILTLALIRVPDQVCHAAGESKTSLVKDILSGWQYLRTRPELLRLIALFTLGNAFGAFFIVLYTPLVLSFSNPMTLGTLSSIGGMGMLAGSLIIGIWGGPKRRITGVILTAVFECASIILIGLQPSVILVGIGTLLIYLNIPINNGLANAVIQSIVPSDRQGRVFGLLQMLGSAIMPLSFLAAGPLVDRVFEPLMAPDGVLASTIGSLIGVGQGRGIALVFIILGVAYIACLAGAFSSPRLRSIEESSNACLSFDYKRETSII
jgi:MFS transporter, DHA3 family, macrolide efflux protein